MSYLQLLFLQQPDKLFRNVTAKPTGTAQKTTQIIRYIEYGCNLTSINDT